MNIYFQLRSNKYITKDGHVTDTFRKLLAENKLAPFTEELGPYSEQIYRRVQSIFDPHALDNMIENGGKPRTPENKLNDNFSRKEFQELWHRINHKYAYVVNFDSKELIDKAIAAIDQKLHVSELSYVVTSGVQRNDLTGNDMKEGCMLENERTAYNTLRSSAVSNVRYDLLGKIASNTKLTRRTVASILCGISQLKFNMYKFNPEKFISEVSRLILEQKATMIVEHISYNRIAGEYSSDIFTQEKHAALDRAYAGKKSIADYVFTDGTAR